MISSTIFRGEFTGGQFSGRQFTGGEFSWGQFTGGQFSGGQFTGGNSPGGGGIFRGEIHLDPIKSIGLFKKNNKILIHIFSFCFATTKNYYTPHFDFSFSTIYFFYGFY